MTKSQIESTINYEFDQRPDMGETMEVAPGIFWLRMHLPFALSHINLWLLEDNDGWTVIDTGVAIDECKSIWRKTHRNRMQGLPVHRVIVTHLHPDHMGCAGWLSRRFGAPLWMTRDEYFLGRILVADTGRKTPIEGDRFYKSAGFHDNQLEHYHKMFGLFGKFVHPLPESFHRMKDGDRISIGDQVWEVLVGRGHSPEHACLYCEKLNLLISGDQLLPTISSNVSVFPTEPEADPLADWLHSLETLKESVPEDVLVLPAHGKPFRGAHGRLDALIAEHHEDLAKLVAYCAEPRRAIDAFPVLFRTSIDSNNLIMATGESIAHLNYLLSNRRITVSQDKEGVNWYCSR